MTFERTKVDHLKALEAFTDRPNERNERLLKRSLRRLIESAKRRTAQPEPTKPKAKP